jgi:hypothetical protein
VITNAPSSAFERGGCSHATGCTRREILPIAERDFDCTAQERISHFIGASLTTRTLLTVRAPPGRKRDADAQGTATRASPAASAAASARMSRE